MPAIYIPIQEYDEPVSDGNNPTPTFPYDPIEELLKIEQKDKNLFQSLLNKYYQLVKKEVNERDPISLYQLGNIHFLRKNYSRAENIYKNVLAIDQNYLPAYDRVILSILLQLPNNTKNVNPRIRDSIRDKVNKYYLSYLEATDRRVDILHNYVLFRLVFFQDNKDIFDESLKNLTAILKTQTNNFAAMDTIGFIYLIYKNDISKAKEWFKKAL